MSNLTGYMFPTSTNGAMALECSYYQMLRRRAIAKILQRASSTYTDRPRGKLHIKSNIDVEIDDLEIETQISSTLSLCRFSCHGRFLHCLP